MAAVVNVALALMHIIDINLISVIKLALYELLLSL